MRKGQEDDIREAVFQHQIAGHKSEFYLLRLVDEEKQSVDPTEEFLERFKDLKVSLGKQSDGKITPPTNKLTDAASGKPALRLTVVHVKWMSDDEVNVHGSEFSNGLSASGYFYVLEKRDGKWTVTKSVLRWLS